jgi:hypothetical protein
MPPPRLSQGAEAARAAALQAEFNEKKWVWVPDDKEGYLAGWVNTEEDDLGEIAMASGGEVRLFGVSISFRVNVFHGTVAEGPFICLVQDEPAKV